MRKITVRLLKRHDVCESQIEKFKELFGNSVEPTEILCVKHYRDFDLLWAAGNLLPREKWLEYAELIRAARDKCLVKKYSSNWFLKAKAKAFATVWASQPERKRKSKD